MKIELPVLLLIFLGGTSFGQEPLRSDVIGQLNPSQRIEEIREYQGELRELRVLAPTLAAEEIDRAVLNKLMQEIIDDPQTAENRLGISAEKIEDILK